MSPRTVAPRALAIGLLFVAAGCAKEDPLQICLLGEVRCVEGGVEACSKDGTKFVPSTCGPGRACVPATCSDEDRDAGKPECFDVCKDQICSPGERVCGEDNVFVYECGPTGTSVRGCGSCAAPPASGVCHNGQCVSLCGSDQKSYIGCEYYGLDLDNAYVPCQVNDQGEFIFCDAQGAQYAIVVSNTGCAPGDTECVNPNLSAFVSVTIDIPAGAAPGSTCDTEPTPDPAVVAAAVIPPKGLHIFELPRRDVNGTVKDKLAYRVTSNVPITAYQFNPLENVDVFSNDASLLLPVNSVGTEYLIMSREQTHAELRGQLAIVGVTDTPASVEVTVTARTLGGAGIPVMGPGDTFATTLSRFEVLSIESDGVGTDFTGSRIRSSQPIVVYGASEAANAPTNSLCDLTTMRCAWDQTTPCACTAADGPSCNPHNKCSSFITCCADHLEEQLFPVTAWGKEYVAVRSVRRGNELEVWRILAGYDDTQVTLTGEPDVTVPTLDAGEWFEFESDADFVISATKAISVGQFQASEHAPAPGEQDGDAKTGDPSMNMVVPTRQFRDTYIFLAPNKYLDDYLALASTDLSEVRLDSQLIVEVPAAELGDIPGTPYRTARLRISDGVHIVTCPHLCSIMVHGYDQYVSYGYPGGLNLKDDDG